jgi:FKBP-type peptidyl-prolyl cis-trans isomerase FkpA
MTKIKHLFLLVCIAGCFAACSKDNDTVDDFDYVGQFNTDTTLIRKFITDNNIPAIKDKSGVFYQVLLPGNRVDTVIYSTSTVISGPYEGKLLNGTSFGTGTLTNQLLSGLITGWQIAIPRIQKGGKIRMLIPSYYAYGPYAQGTVPANSVLDFTVTLTDVR